MARRYKSVKSGKELFSSKDDDNSSFEDNHGLVYPGGKIAFTSEMSFLPGSSEERYREQGVLLCRGFTLKDVANICFGNSIGHGKGRNIPLHYGSKKLNAFTNSAPLATQLPHAVGVAYSLKTDGKDACVVAYFGDGSTSEGDFHASMNFAAVLEAPIVFICRNIGWAISTPVTEQFRSDGVVAKGQAYGIQSIRVDGNDVLTVYNAVHCARDIAINEQRPILIEVKNAIDAAEREEKTALRDMFTDVYEEVPLNLVDQERSLRETIHRHKKDFPTNVPL
ncbi:2-oxoisovalerate dehydrogenase subunit alpha 2 mitochondrial [Tanacetum coccineum]